MSKGDSIDRLSGCFWSDGTKVYQDLYLKSVTSNL